MGSRRLVNLAMTDYKNRIFSMHRIDLAKLLFYPSTADAEAAGGKGKPPKLGRLRLPPPVMGFDPFPIPASSDPPLFHGAAGNMFALLHGRHGHAGRSSSSGDSEPSRILFASSEGQASMYDLDSRSVVSVPDLSAPTRSRDDMPKHIVTGASVGEERLYVMRASGHFELLDFSGGGGDDSRKTFSTNRTLTWQSLPPLPAADCPYGPYICSTTVVDGGRIICVSFAWSGGNITFCFDTASQEWWKAGDWVLPFYGRAEYVPELDTWLGFSPKHYACYLCAADLSGVTMAPREAPTLRHVWEDFEPPPMEETSTAMYGVVLTRKVYWSVARRFLINLGSGRFCVAKVINGEEFVSACWTVESHEGPKETFTVLTGVELIRDGADGGELRMVKHKTRELVHPGLDVACVL